MVTYCRNDYCRIPGRLDRPGIARLLEPTEKLPQNRFDLGPDKDGKDHDCHRNKDVDKSTILIKPLVPHGLALATVDNDRLIRNEEHFSPHQVFCFGRSLLLHPLNAGRHCVVTFIHRNVLTGLDSNNRSADVTIRNLHALNQLSVKRHPKVAEATIGVGHHGLRMNHHSNHPLAILSGDA